METSPKDYIVHAQKILEQFAGEGCGDPGAAYAALDLETITIPAWDKLIAERDELLITLKNVLKTNGTDADGRCIFCCGTYYDHQDDCEVTTARAALAKAEAPNE